LTGVGAREAAQVSVIYFEGPTSTRLVQLLADGGRGREREAPFTLVGTHGWVLDASGRAMHKSLGNVISPLTLIENTARTCALVGARHGLARRLRVGDEILQRVADAYRKVRNTLRFLLGTCRTSCPRAARSPRS